MLYTEVVHDFAKFRDFYEVLSTITFVLQEDAAIAV